MDFQDLCAVPAAQQPLPETFTEELAQEILKDLERQFAAFQVSFEAMVAEVLQGFRHELRDELRKELTAQPLLETVERLAPRCFEASESHREEGGLAFRVPFLHIPEYASYGPNTLGSARGAWPAFQPSRPRALYATAQRGVVGSKRVRLGYAG